MGTFRRLLAFLSPYRPGVRWSLGLAVLAMALTVAIPYLVGRAIDAVDDGDSAALTRLSLLVLAAGALRFGLTFARRMVAGRVSLGVEYDLRELIYGHLLSLELGFFDRQQTGQLMSRATVDLQSVRFFLGYGLIFIVQSALTISLAGVAMFLVDPGLAALSLVPVPFVVVVATRYGLRSRPAIQQTQQRIAELTADIEESISGVRVIKAFAAEGRQIDRVRASTARVFSQAMVSTRLQGFYQPFIGFLPQLGLAAVLFLGGRRVIDGALTPGQFTAFYTYLLMLLAPMRTLGVALGMAQRATASGARLFQILDRAPEIEAAPGAGALPPGPGRVELRDVTLRYAGSPQPALEGIDLALEGGRTIAVVGATGSGKTSLVALLGRLYDVDRGAVLIDGVDVRDVAPGHLRSEIAVVTDDPFLFSASVAENIAYARADATLEDVRAAARAAQAEEFVLRLPDGYDTQVGERGLTLSGGQRQRLAIARALLADPRILVLDDATSSVDASTEGRIKDALAAGAADRTTFIIAHRLSTLALADEIVVLEQGRIADRGTHEELLAREGLYREIVEKGLPEQVFLTRKPREPEVAGPVSTASHGARAEELRRRLRGTSGRGRRLRGLATLLKPYRWRVIAMLVALGIGTGAALAPAPLARKAIDDGIGARDVGVLDLVVVLFIASALLVWAGGYVQTYLTGWVGQRALQDLRMQTFTHLSRQPVAYYERRPAGVLISRMTNDVEALDSLVTDSVTTLFTATLTLVGSVVILLFFDVELALITFGIFPLVILASFLFRVASADAYKKTRETISLITAYLQESLSGIRIVESFAQEPRHRQRFAQLNRDNQDANLKTVTLNAVYFPSVELVASIATVIVLLVGGHRALNGDLTLGVLAAFTFALNGFFDPINQLSQVYTTYQSGMAALDKIFEVLEEEVTLEDKPGAVELPSPLHGELRFEGVQFAYHTDDGVKRALSDLELTIPPGETVALVGATGAGKSTLAKLVARFYDPTDGRITIDGLDLRDIRIGSLREQLGIVPRRRSCSAARSPRTSRSRAATPPGSRSRPRWRPSVPRSSWRAWSTAWTPRSASVGCSSPRASASSSRSHARWSPIPAC